MKSSPFIALVFALISWGLPQPYNLLVALFAMGMSVGYLVDRFF